MRPSPGSSAALERELAWLSGFAAHLVRDGALADDACQEAWVHALEQGGSPSRNELARRVRLFLSEHWRSAARRRRREVRVARPERVASAADELEDAEALAQLAARLDALAEPFRSTLRARYRDGLSPAEIAERVGLAEDTVRWRLREGAGRLRRSLDRRHLAVLTVRFGLPDAAGTSAEGSAVAAVRAATVPTSPLVWIGMKALLTTSAVALALLGATWLFTSGGKPARVEHAVGASEPTRSVQVADLTGHAGLRSQSPPVVLEGAERAVHPSLADLPAVPPVPPALLVVELHPEVGTTMPERVSVRLVGITEAGIAEESTFEEVAVTDGIVRIALERHGDFALLPIVGTELHLRAPGLLDAKAVVDVDWTPGAESTVAVELRPGRELWVQIVDGRDGEPLDDVMVEVVGAAGLFGETVRRTTADPLRLTRPPVHGDGDWLFAHSRKGGLVAGAWTLDEIERQPPDRDGVRVLELHPGATIEGQLRREDGLPLAAGCAVHFATRLGSGTSDVAYPHWVARDGIAAVDEAGRFRVTNVPRGACVLELRTAGNAVEALALAPPRVVPIADDATTFVDWLVPTEQDVLVLDLEWHTSELVLLFFDLYRLDDAGERTLLATRHFAPPNVPLPVRLPSGTLDPAARYLLRIGNDVNAREEHLLRVEASHAVLAHRFVLGDDSTLVAKASAAPDR